MLSLVSNYTMIYNQHLFIWAYHKKISEILTFIVILSLFNVQNLPIMLHNLNTHLYVNCYVAQEVKNRKCEPL